MWTYIDDYLNTYQWVIKKDEEYEELDNKIWMVSTEQMLKANERKWHLMMQALDIWKIIFFKHLIFRYAYNIRCYVMVFSYPKHIF